MSKDFPIQGSDSRLNSEKPKTTWQEAYDAKMADGSDVRILAVHVSDDPTSAVYFRGVPEAYKGGAVHREELAPDFVGDPAEATEE
jgi:hypothetical protein